MIRIISIFFSAALLLVSQISSAETGPTAPLSNQALSNQPLSNQQVQVFIDTMVTQYHYNRADLTALFAKAQIVQRSIDLLNAPYEAKPWYVYRPHFITEQRINEGVKFWAKIC